MVNTSTQPTSDVPAVDVGGRVLARNTLLNIGGQVLPLIVNLATVPYVVRNLGADRFGMLSLAWMVVGYFALFDLGIGPATTKFVAEHIGKREHDRIPSVVWTALICQSLLGLVAGIALVAVTPVLVENVLSIPADLHHEAYWVLGTLAISFPISFASGSSAGVLSASQRFDLLNLINVPTSCLTYLLPACALSLGYGLRMSVALVVVARLIALLVSLGFASRLHRTLRKRFHFDWSIVKRLLGFGGWVALSGAVGPVLMYFDRLLFGALVSIAAIGFFTPPYMIASKLGILHGALLPTLFPAFCTAHAKGDNAWIRSMFVRCVKLLVIAVGPAAILLVAFARPLLSVWIGEDFASHGALVLQVLAIGVFFNSITHMPVALIQGIGRADLTAKLQLVQVPIHIALVCLLTWQFGLAGGAVAWSARMVLECVLFVIAGCALKNISARQFFSTGLRGALLLVGLFAGALAATWAIYDTVALHAIAAAIFVLAFAVAAWRSILGADERDQIRVWLRLRR
jgi:O-antigen/teichoic acid export membrane protein